MGERGVVPKELERHERLAKSFVTFLRAQWDRIYYPSDCNEPRPGDLAEER